MRPATDLLVQYATYHRDQRNISSHFVGIPMIVCAIGTLLARPAVAVGDVVLTPAVAVFALAALWYLSRDLVLGVATVLAAGLLFWIGHNLAQISVAAGLGWGLGLFAVGWVIQFLGHYYEGRKPAFVDDLVGLLVGPMFVMAEALFALGWNPALQREIVRRAGPSHLRNLAHGA
ncbi:MAG: DUF962 domain-containing protein [Burkholderiales bacterium]|nr:DUF962 domain-containing protein [Burkholderiales bacterium]